MAHWSWNMHSVY